jgi:hypothetical protein
MIIVIIGPMGCGKTTIGKILARKTSWLFYDADDYHPEVNKQKMADGIPLDDNDRQPWLEILKEVIDDHLSSERDMILACSALKKKYRRLLGIDQKNIRSIYQPIRELTRKHDAGIHVKTAGTTWLEELIGLAEAAGEGLDIAKRVYAASYHRYDELCTPYESVIDIDREALPHPDELQDWTSEQYVSALRHDQSCPDYDVNLRQLLHVGYKVAAEMGDVYLTALQKNEEVVAKNVTENLFDRHLVPLFL